MWGGSCSGKSRRRSEDGTRILSDHVVMECPVLFPYLCTDECGPTMSSPATKNQLCIESAPQFYRLFFHCILPVQTRRSCFAWSWGIIRPRSRANDAGVVCIIYRKFPLRTNMLCLLRPLLACSLLFLPLVSAIGITARENSGGATKKKPAPTAPQIQKRCSGPDFNSVLSGGGGIIMVAMTTAGRS